MSRYSLRSSTLPLIVGVIIPCVAALMSAHGQTATRADIVRKTKSNASLPPSSSRQLAEQLSASIDAGDSYAAPNGRRRLRRLPGVVTLQNSEQRGRTVDTLTRQDGPLARYRVQTQLGRGRFSVLEAPSEPRLGKRRNPQSEIEILKQARRSGQGASLNPVFIEPKSGLRLIATEQLIVSLKPGVNAAQHFGSAWKNVRPLWGSTDQFVVSLPGATAEEIFAEVDRQSASGNVAWAEPDWISQVVRASTPNDTYFHQQWHLENTGQGFGTPGADARLPAAWDQSTGNPNIVIAIVDDGVQLDHPDLSANIFVNTGEIANNGFDDDGNGLVDDRQGYNFVVNLPDASPYSVDDNHGTAVAGLAAATGNNNLGTVGVAYGCRILPIKVLEGDYSATTSDFAKALRHVAGLNSSGNRVWRGADVVNISLTFGQSLVTDAALNDLVTKGRNGRGAALFVAAGNYAAAWEPVEYDVTEAGTYTLIFEYSKDQTDQLSVGADTVWIDSIHYPNDTFETFENGFPADWSTSQFSPWRVVTEGVSGNKAMTGWNGFGSKSLRAGPLNHNQTNYAQVTKTLTPGKLVFWTWVSSEYQYDFFDFWVGHNGTETLIFSQSGVPILEEAVSYPGSNPNAIAVGASTDFDYRADYSQYGPQLDFLAPTDGGATAVVTTDRTGSAGYNSGATFNADYTADFGGTSGATPISSGVAALVLSVNPYLTASDIRSLLRGTCDQIGHVSYDSAGRNLFYGSGRINAARAVAQSRPNLRVTLAAPTEPISAGDLMTYSIAVRNVGFSRSGLITLTNPLPPGVTFVSSSPSPQSQAGGVLTYMATGLVAGATWTIEVKVSTSTAGTKTLIAGVRNDVVEISTADNLATGDVPVLPVPEISITDAEVTEGNSGKTNVALHVTLSNASSRTVTVGCQTVTNTASAGSDFGPLNTTLKFLPGETEKTVLIGVVGDTRNEADESFFVRLQSPVNAMLVDDSATVTILNDDSLPVVSGLNLLRKEGNGGLGKAVFRFRLSAPSGRTASVDYNTIADTAQMGVDFLPTNGTLIFLPGKTTANVTVLIPGDKILETNETFFVALSNPMNCDVATNLIACTILNNDPPPKAYIDDAGVVEGSSGNANVSLTVRLATASDLPVTMAYSTTNGTAVAGSDYVATSGVLTFAPGETNQTIQIEVVGDSDIEPLETFSVRLSNPTNAILARSLARVSITNDDVALTVGAGFVMNLLDPLGIQAGTPPRLEGQLKSDTFLVRILGLSGRYYVIEWTEQLGAGAVWQQLTGPLRLGTGAVEEIEVPRERSGTGRFYRIRVL
jgi:uncharacterized repeat protein (TIGR01451 family)